MATDKDAGKSSRRKPRTRWSTKVRIDWTFGDPIDPQELELGDAQDLEDGALEFAEGPGGLQTLTFTPQHYLRTLPITEDTIAAFAQEFGIERRAELRQVFALIAREIAKAESGSGWIMRWRGEAWDVPESHVAAHHLATKYVGGLLKLLSGPFWPVALDEHPERARKALVKYRRWLDEFEFGRLRPKKGAPPLVKHQAAMYVLAWAWPVLTHAEPVVAVRPQVDPKRPGRERDRPLSPFHAAFSRVCDLFALGRKPDSKTLDGWLAATAEARAAHHAKLDQLYGADGQNLSGDAAPI